ncbi:IS200/IS605 family element transposase accessory protein TnpB [Candidatus Woesearchaeota archaeon]|nr:IS200/IS605 family element transposase accessory protein TnpB [Candidatus Woesearchaeota archaeon]
MQITHKFRLYPNKQQEEKLFETLNLCRQTYNNLLAEFDSWEYISKYELQSIITSLKICDSRLKTVYSKTLQYENYRLFSNLKALSNKKKKGYKVGRLRFKGEGWFKTFTYNQSGFKLINTGKRCQILHLSKIGDIRIRCHRNIKGKIKQITVKHIQSGKWFASVTEERKQEIKQQAINKIVGIDLGLTDTVYDSDSNKITNPRHLKKKAEKLAHLQRRMSRKKKRSNNRNRWRIRLARQYEKLVNSRGDFLHKLSRYYVDNYDAIAMEDMPIPNIVHNHKLSKSILDSCWGKLRQYISYKAENAGKLYMPVDYKGTTQRCSQCGKLVPKDLSEREHKCPNCGFEVPRDYNSALEIKRLCLQKIRQELPESTLVEMESISHKGQILSLKQEAPCVS